MIRKNAMGIMALACLATVLSAGLAAQTFATGGAGTINNSGAATPYPSTINVSGLSGTVTGVTVTINGMTHTWTSDVDIVLVGPTGQNIILMSDCCGSGDLTGVNITFDDAAAGTIPAATTNLATGSYRPTIGGGAGVFASPHRRDADAASRAVRGKCDSKWNTWVKCQ